MKILEKKLDINSVYTVYIKIRYDEENFFMAGNQFGFVYKDKESLNQVFNTGLSRLSDYMDEYGLVEHDIVYVEFILVSAFLFIKKSRNKPEKRCSFNV